MYSLSHPRTCVLLLHKQCIYDQSIQKWFLSVLKKKPPSSALTFTLSCICWPHEPCCTVTQSWWRYNLRCFGCFDPVNGMYYTKHAGNWGDDIQGWRRTYLKTYNFLATEVYAFNQVGYFVRHLFCKTYAFLATDVSEPEVPCNTFRRDRQWCRFPN